MAEGKSNGAIADTLVISERAVEKHVANIFSKFSLTPSDTDHHRRVLAVLRYLGSAPADPLPGHPGHPGHRGP
jgi:DNA-binding NarL/FixJ family response regulator